MGGTRVPGLYTPGPGPRPLVSQRSIFHIYYSIYDERSAAESAERMEEWTKQARFLAS